MGRSALIAALGALCATPVVAGPPYLTDDPEPTDFRHWEIYNFIDLAGLGGDIEGSTGLDINYGGAKDLQLTATLPVAFTRTNDERWRAGRGDIELAAKYRFLHDEKHGWEAAVFPRLILPTAAHNMGGTRARLLLPLWVQKDTGKTCVFGGGGYEINPGSGNRGFWQAGVALTHDFSDKFSVGTEIAWQSADTRGGSASTAVNLGLIRKLGGSFALLLAAGPSFSSGKAAYHSYAAVSLNF